MEQAIPILPADDLAVARAFYVDGLGFRVLFEASEDGRSGLLGLERGTIRLTLDSPMDGHGRNACVSLEVEDADAYYREWSAKVDVLRPPRDEEWNARTFDLLDPFGNTIFVMGPVAAAALAASSVRLPQHLANAVLAQPFGGRDGGRFRPSLQLLNADLVGHGRLTDLDLEARRRPRRLDPLVRAEQAHAERRRFEQRLRRHLHRMLDAAGIGKGDDARSGRHETG